MFFLICLISSRFCSFMGFLPFAPEHLPCSVGALAYRAAVLQPCQVCIATKACSVGTLVGNALLACGLAALPGGKPAVLKLWQVRRSSLAVALVFNSCQVGCSFELEPSLAACLGSVLEVPVWWWKSCSRWQEPLPGY